MPLGRKMWALHWASGVTQEEDVVEGDGPQNPPRGVAQTTG